MKKKLVVILLSALVVLSIGQAAFASSNVGLSAGYVGATGTKFFGAEVFGEYQFSNLFSLGGDLNMGFLGGGSIRGYANLMGKFNIFGTNLFNVGALLNVATAYEIYNGVNFSQIHVGPGIYGEVNLFDKLSISATAKFTMLYVELATGATTTNFTFKPTSIHLSVSYGITDNIAIGVKGMYEFGNVYSVGLTAQYNF